jgi:hypothetical protein
MPLPTHTRAHTHKASRFFFRPKQTVPQCCVARINHTCWRQSEVNAGVVIMLRRKAIQIVRRIRRRTCAAHFDGLQPKPANLPDGSTALPWPQPQVSEEPPRSHPVASLNSQRCERPSVNYGNDTTRTNATCEVDSVGGRLHDSSHKAVFCEQIVRTTRCNWQNSASEIETNTKQYWYIG